MRLIDLIPCITKRRLPLNADGSVVDTGEQLIDDERGPFYADVYAIEWFNCGISFWSSGVINSRTGEKAVLYYR